MKKLLLLFFALLCLTGTAKAATPELSFDELYSGGGVLGLQFSDKVKNLAGQRITIRGFMAPPLKAEAAFFVLTRGHGGPESEGEREKRRGHRGADETVRRTCA